MLNELETIEDLPLEDIEPIEEDGATPVLQPIETKPKKEINRGAKLGVNSVRLSSNDVDIIAHCMDKGAFSTYVKRLIREDIARTNGTFQETTPQEQVSSAEFSQLNAKLNQVLAMLEKGVTVNAPASDDVIVFPDGPDPRLAELEDIPQEPTEVTFGNENAHKFSANALTSVTALLSNQFDD